MVTREPLLAPKPVLGRCLSHMDDELRSFRLCLRWMCVDQSSPWRSAVSWSLYFLLAIVVPIVSCFVLSYSEYRRPYNSVVQLSLTAAASLAFFYLSGFFRKYGLRRFLFLDKLRGESRRVQLGYAAELNRSFQILSFFVMPCFIAECGYKVWWYYAGARRIPFLGNPVASDVVACTLELASWIYRTSIFLLLCVIFRVICHLQILRLQDFAMVFQEESEVAAVLQVHFKIRRLLAVVSRRFCKFIVATVVLVTGSQFATLFLMTRPHAMFDPFNIGQLTLCSVMLVTGLLICFA